MAESSIRKIQKSRRPSRRFFFSGDMADRFEPALVHNRPCRTESIRGTAGLPFRPGLIRSGSGPRGLEWDI